MPTSNTASNSKPNIPRILLTTGEPAGIGPDLLVTIADLPFPAQLICLSDPDLLIQRARRLARTLELVEYRPDRPLIPHRPGELIYRCMTTPKPAQAGILDTGNVTFVLDSIAVATRACLNGEFDALVTLPVNKSVINAAGHAFSGHTEYIAALCDIDLPVMMLMNQRLRVALVTTHMPLSRVPAAITPSRLERILRVIHADLTAKLDIPDPRMLVCGLNPHAGEGGYLGSEEIDVMLPVLDRLQAQGMSITGPVPADTAFTPGSLQGMDVVVAMYHDQGLPALKAQGFGETVNVTLGLPIIRTSVDHGTALELAGTGKASAGSLCAAISLAIEMVLHTARAARAA
jgi:4-hydroxythreonine-4-phosphate dehydrogenase